MDGDRDRDVEEVALVTVSTYPIKVFTDAKERYERKRGKGKSVSKPVVSAPSPSPSPPGSPAASPVRPRPRPLPRIITQQLDFESPRSPSPPPDSISNRPHPRPIATQPKAGPSHLHHSPLLEEGQTVASPSPHSCLPILEGHAVGSDGRLKDAREMSWANSPSDES